MLDFLRGAPKKAGTTSRERPGQFPEVPSFAPVGGAERGSNFSETLTVPRPADLPAHGYRTEVTLTLFGGEPGARGTRLASGRIPLVELPRQRARRSRRGCHAARALLFARALARRAPRCVRGAVRAIQSSFSPACFTIDAYRSFCRLRNSAYSSGALPAGSRPRAMKRLLMSGSWRTFRVSAESRARNSFGIPAGDMKPIQPDIS